MLPRFRSRNQAKLEAIKNQSYLIQIKNTILSHILVSCDVGVPWVDQPSLSEAKNIYIDSDSESVESQEMPEWAVARFAARI
jgi:hypothetical protein